MKRILYVILCLLLVMPVEAGRPKIGLALGGGGAKGAAEVGVLKVLEEVGIKPDIIVGTSAGSIVGALYSAGYTAAELDTMYQTQEWLSLLTDFSSTLADEPYKKVDGITYIFGFPIHDPQARGAGVMRGVNLEHMIDSMGAARGCTDFEHLQTTFRCMAADIHSGEEVALGEGSLARAVRASMSIPGIFKPVEINGHTLVDGGMFNNLPVDVCRQLGADIVIAVDLQQNELKPHKQTDLSLFEGLADLLGIRVILNWITNRPDIAKYNQNRQQADILINPSLDDASVTSFGNKNSARMIQAGEEATRALMSRLTELKAQLLDQESSDVPPILDLDSGL